MTLRLFFVDDHPIVADGLMQRFARPGFTVVGSAPSVELALKQLARAKVDVVVLDVQLERLITPDDVRALTAHAKVVLFSSRRIDEHVRALLDAGAACFLDKVAPLSTLDETLFAVGRGEAAPAHQQPVGVRALVSEREYEVYRALLVAPTPKEVAAHLGIAASTVYCHLDNLRKKLKVQSVPELVAHALTHRDS